MGNLRRGGFMMQTTVYLNQRELAVLSQIALELKVGLTATVKAIVREFLERNSHRVPEDIAKDLEDYISSKKERTFDIP